MNLLTPAEQKPMKKVLSTEIISGNPWLHPSLLPDSSSRRTLTIPSPIVANPPLLRPHSSPVLRTHPRNFLSQLNPLPFYSGLQEPGAPSAGGLHSPLHSLLHPWPPPLQSASPVSRPTVLQPKRRLFPHSRLFSKCGLLADSSRRRPSTLFPLPCTILSPN